MAVGHLLFSIPSSLASRYFCPFCQPPLNSAQLKWPFFLWLAVYRLHKYNTAFIDKFAALLPEISLNYDCIVLVGDFNIRVARSKYFANIITANRTNQQTLYKTINAAPSPCLTSFPLTPSVDLCNSFLLCFIEKVSKHIYSFPLVFHPVHHCSTSLDHFDQITLD